ncbi:hypothetical protein [Rhizobium sp.]
MAVHEPLHHNRDRDGRVVLTPTEARQGMLGRPVLYVLVVGLLLAMLAWAAAEFWGMSIDTQTPADSSTVTAPATQPASDTMIDDNPVPGGERQTEPAIVDPQPTGNQ